MSDYPYWDNRDIRKVVEIDLILNQRVTLEDGLFYGNSLEVFDVNGNKVSVRLMSQDQDETAVAGEGIYGQFSIDTKPTNPCTIKYTPRFMITREDHAYVKESFEHVSGVDISSFTNNIDDLVRAIVPPTKVANLSLGNFANNQVLCTALTELAATIEHVYYSNDELPEAIEEVYLNAKGGTVDALEQMRNLKVKTLDASTVMSESVKLLNRPPEGELYGNYLFIAFKDQEFTYRGPRKVRRGDVVIIEQGEIEIFPFGSHYYDRLDSITSMIGRLDAYANNIQDGLLTYAKDLRGAIEEFKQSMNGYFDDSLYIDNDIQSAAAFVDKAGTIIGVIRSEFQYIDETYHDGDVVMIHDARVVKLGISPSEMSNLIEVNYNLSVRYKNLSKVLGPVNTLRSTVSILEGSTIPSKSESELRVEASNLYLGDQALNRPELTTQIQKQIALFKQSGGYINNDELLRLLSRIPKDDTRLSTIEGQLNRLDDIMSKKAEGEFVLVPYNHYSKSMFYYMDKPIEIKDGVLTISGYGTWSLNDLTVKSITFADDEVVLITDSGLWVLDFINGMIVRPNGLKTATTATNAIAFNGDMACLTAIGNTTLVETINETHVVPGTVIGAVPNSQVLILSTDNGVTLYNAATSKVKGLSAYATRALNTPSGVVLVHNDTPTGVIKNGKFIPYRGLIVANRGFIISDSYPHPTVSMDAYPIHLKMVVL